VVSLFGLVLAIGLVVDDANRGRGGGRAPHGGRALARDATLQAMKEVSAPVVSVAVILASVFIPMAFMGGITGASTSNSRSPSPFPSSSPPSTRSRFPGALGVAAAAASGFERPGRPVFRGFQPLVRPGDQRIRENLAPAHPQSGPRGRHPGRIRRFGGARGSPHSLGFVPDEDQGFFFLNVQLPDASSLERTDAVCRKIEAILAATPRSRLQHGSGLFRS